MFTISTDGISSTYHVGSGASRLKIYDYSAPHTDANTNTHINITSHGTISSLLIVGGGCSGADISNYVPAGFKSKGGNSGKVHIYPNIATTDLTGGNASITTLQIQLGGGGVIPSSNSYNTNSGSMTSIGVSNDYLTWSTSFTAEEGKLAEGKGFVHVNGSGSRSNPTGKDGGVGTQWVDGNYYAAGGGEGGTEAGGGTFIPESGIASGVGGSGVGGDGRKTGGKPGTGSGGGAGFHGGSGCVKIAIADPE